MEQTYPLTLEGSNVGTVILERQGLYFLLHCRCRLPDEQMVRLYADGERSIDLGILVPVDGLFGLDTRIPVSRLGTQALSFRLSPTRKHSAGRLFIPVSPEEPFAYLSRLEGAFLEIRGGKPGISLRPGED